jgi:tetratricopeptide (TPR) repeat protein
VSAKTVALFGHLGSVADWGLALNPSAEKAQQHLEKEMRKWGRFTVVSDPAKADLILFLAEGNRAAGGGGVINTALLRVFQGGRAPQRGEVPLWQAVESSNPYLFTSGTGKVISRFRRDLEELDRRKILISAVPASGVIPATSASASEEKAKPAVAATSGPEGTTTASSPSACVSGPETVAVPAAQEPIPPRPPKYISPLEVIAKAKTFAVIGKGSMGEQGFVERMAGIGKYANVDTAMQDIVFQMTLWSRFMLEKVPAKADLVVIVYQWDERAYSRQFHAVRSAIQVAEGGAAFQRRDPALWASGTFRGTTSGIVSYLQDDLDRFEKAQIGKASAGPDKNFQHANDWLRSAEKKKDGSQANETLFEAVGEFRESLRDNPAYAPAHAGLGKALLDLEFDAAAAYEFKLALTVEPEAHDTLMNLGKALGKIPDRGAALDAVHQAMRIAPGRVEDQIVLGDVLFSAHDYSGSAKAYAEALRLRSDDPEVLFNMGRAQYRDNNFDAAETSFRQTLQLKPDHAYAWYWLGATLNEKKRPEEAVLPLRKALALGLRRASLHYELGRALRGEKSYEEAIAEFKEALKEEPDTSVYHNELAHTFVAAGKSDEALAEFRETVKLGPGSAHFRDDLGSALLTKTHVDEAIAEFNRAIALDPTYASAHFDLGRAREAKGDKICALVAYQTALALEPENPEFKKKIEAVAK